MEEQSGSLLQFSNRQSRVRRVVARTCRTIESAASGDEGDRPASAELSNTADLPTTEKLAGDAAAIPEPLAWTNRQLIDEVPLENMLNVLIETFLFRGSPTALSRYGAGSACACSALVKALLYAEHR